MALIWSGDTGHIGIHRGVDGRTVVRSPKLNFLAQVGYHIFLPMVLRMRTPWVRGAPLLLTTGFYHTLRKVAVYSNWVSEKEGFPRGPF